jgi:hypothetical protein
MRRTGSSGAIADVTRSVRASVVRFLVARHAKGGCILFSRTLFVCSFLPCASLSIAPNSACGNVSVEHSYPPLFFSQLKDPKNSIITTDLSYWEIASGSAFFQFSLYVAVRLGHRGFTLGELGLVVFGATSLFTESVNLTVAKVRRLRRARTETDAPCRETDMARDNNLHQDISPAHTAAYFSVGSHSRVAADWPPVITSTHAVSAHCTATCTSSEVPTREASTPTCTRGRVLSRCGVHCWWADR